MKYLCVTPAVEEALRRVIDRHFNETVDIRTIFSNIEKINVFNSKKEKRTEVNGFSVMHSEPIMSNHEDTISNTEIVLDN